MSDAFDKKIEQLQKEQREEHKLFFDWVKKWNIGPGMNDHWRGRGPPPADYVPPKNYTGYDGVVGDGWVPILDELAEKLVALGWDRDIAQVKEKFGVLRVYAGMITPEMNELICAAEAKSAHICEKCGDNGVLRNTGWRKTLCDACVDNTDS